ncbi:hypothetical protein ACIBEK_21455 [Nocardia fusca]
MLLPSSEADSVIFCQVAGEGREIIQIYEGNQIQRVAMSRALLKG